MAVKNAIVSSVNAAFRAPPPPGGGGQGQRDEGHDAELPGQLHAIRLVGQAIVPAAVSTSTSTPRPTRYTTKTIVEWFTRKRSRPAIAT